MDLSAYSLQKLNREKRERQPNWTEPEKQLLLSLTRMHQSILENKGSDTMTIKRKSEAWDDIALRMKVAGYNRSKERLKQQLGRIRAAEAKRIKDAVERDLSSEHQVKDLNVLSNSSIISEENDAQIELIYKPTKSSLLPEPVPLTEHHYIKIEKKPSIDINECTQEELHENSSSYTKPNVSSCIILNTLKNASNGNDAQVMDNMHFTLQNVQSLAGTNKNITSEIANGCINDNLQAPAITSDSNPPICHNEIKKKFTSFSAANSNNNKPQILQQQRRRLRRMRLNRIHCSSFTREQSLRQLYMYRIAIERERLRSLQLQQKRDRILYRKDIEIQNLKLQILRNLRNQNRSEANRINL